jgi:GPH family glycoside/pentoside/hexuronide:cation symporter
VLGLFQPLFDGFGTNNYIQSTIPKVIELRDTSKNIITENAYVWENKLNEPSQKQPADSLLFLSAKLTAKTKDAFKIGVMNKQTNELSWFEFKEGEDTLGLLRDGSPSDVKIRLSSFVSKGNLTNPLNLKIVTTNNADKDVKIHKIFIQEIDYKSGTQKAVIVITILAVIFFFFTFLWTRERIKPITEKTSLKDDVKDLLKNAPWFILVGAGISTIFFNTIRDGAAIYYFKYYFQGQSDIYFNPINVTLAMSTIYLLLGQAANIIGVLLAKPVSDKIGKKNTFVLAMVFASVFSIMFYFIEKSNIGLILIFQALISLSAGTIFPLVWSMYADAADYSEWKNSRRATGLVFSAASMSQKFGASIGIALAGWLLAFYGYHANVAQTVDTQNGIRMMLSVYPAIGALLAALFMFIYPLKESLMEKIEDDLADRRTIASHKTSYD